MLIDEARRIVDFVVDRKIQILSAKPSAPQRDTTASILAQSTRKTHLLRVVLRDVLVRELLRHCAGKCETATADRLRGCLKGLQL